MKKLLPKILTSTLILAVFFATVLCCSPARAAGAGHSPDLMGKAKGSMPACHHNQSSSSDNNEKPCCYKQLQAVQEVQTSIQVNTPQQFAGSSLAVIPPQSSSHKGLFNCAYLDGPPGSVLEAPFYILSHSFRI